MDMTKVGKLIQSGKMTSGLEWGLFESVKRAVAGGEHLSLMYPVREHALTMHEKGLLLAEALEIGLYRTKGSGTRFRLGADVIVDPNGPYEIHIIIPKAKDRLPLLTHSFEG